MLGILLAPFGSLTRIASDGASSAFSLTISPFLHGMRRMLIERLNMNMTVRTPVVEPCHGTTGWWKGGGLAHWPCRNIDPVGNQHPLIAPFARFAGWWEPIFPRLTTEVNME